MWRIIESEVEIEGVTVKTYGISGRTAEIPDISSDFSEVERFVETLNRLGGSEMQALEFVEDFLGTL